MELNELLASGAAIAPVVATLVEMGKSLLTPLRWKIGWLDSLWGFFVILMGLIIGIALALSMGSSILVGIFASGIASGTITALQNINTRD